MGEVKGTGFRNEVTETDRLRYATLFTKKLAERVGAKLHSSGAPATSEDYDKMYR